MSGPTGVLVMAHGTPDTPEEIEGIYVLKQVTNESLRTGNMHAQTRYDTLGQRADGQLIADDMPIYQYPVVGQRFDRFDWRPR